MTDTKQMKVSVCMITYNHEKFIAQAIESILMQEVVFQYEIVIGEDCSTDNTRQIVIEYQKKHPDKIRLLLPEHNLGMNKNFVETFKACKGQYIAMLEGDDYWVSPHKLQKQVDFLDNHPECSICFHNSMTIWEDNLRPPALSRNNQSKVSTINDLLIQNFISTASVMYRAGLVIEFPNWFYELSMGDWPFNILNAQYGNIGYVDEVMSVYRIHAEGVWTSKSLEWQIKNIIKMFDTIKLHLNHKYEPIIEKSLKLYTEALNRIETHKEQQSAIESSLKKKLPLRDTNLIVFPDWNQPDELLLQDIANVIRVLLNHANKDNITLLIDNSDINQEDADLVLSSVIMHLCIEEELEITEEIQISLIGQLTETEWQILISYLKARIILPRENSSLISMLGRENIPACTLNTFKEQKIFTNQFEILYKLHIGCGNVRFDRWINIDIDENQKAADLVCNAQKLPFDDNSCILIYNEHFLEHLAIEEGLSFLKECHRVLHTGGILRIAMPSLEYAVQKYSSDDWQNQDWLKWPEYHFIKTRAEMLNISFRWWGHKWLYDREELHRRLKQAGFVNIKDVEWGISHNPELKNRETRADSLLICEAEVSK